MPLLLLLLPLLTLSSDPTTLIYSSCSHSQFPPNSPYQLSLNSLLSSLSSASSFSLYSQFTSPSPSSLSGLFQCHGSISLSLCSSCLRSALSRLSFLCPAATSAASIQLRGCYLRYGPDPFLGRTDTALRYKTCSTGGNGGGEGFLAARDRVLAAVAAPPLTGSSYRVAEGGPVRAEAQCAGDLGLRDCDDCVAAAGAKVNASCGGAAAGEVYLGKCYVWYAGGGGNPYDAGGGEGSAGGGNGNDDEVGKTVAIMSGIIAIIVFIAICLHYLRRKAKGKQ